MPVLYIADKIASWFINEVLDKIFHLKKRQNDKIETLMYKKIEKLQDENNKIRQFHEEDKKRIVDSLKRKCLSLEYLLSKYNRPLKAILISYATQGINSKGRHEKSSFIKTELMRYNYKHLGGTDFIIPPNNVPQWIKNRDDLKKWFEDDILKGRYCKIKFLLLIDLKKEIYWNIYLPYKQKRRWHFTIGEKINIDDIFTEEQINEISLSEIIRDGNIAWLASAFLSEKELNVIIRNQNRIENELDNPTLRLYTDERTIPKITKVLSEFIINPKEVAEGIHKEAIYWKEKIA